MNSIKLSQLGVLPGKKYEMPGSGYYEKVGFNEAVDQCADKEIELDEQEIIKILEELGRKQTRAVIRAVDKKGLMNTGWDDIDQEGGSMSFEAIVKALCAQADKIIRKKT